jgi:hypothetical protein
MKETSILRVFKYLHNAVTRDRAGTKEMSAENTKFVSFARPAGT